MKKKTVIKNEDCFITMDRIKPSAIDVVLTSPFYNTNKKAGKTRTVLNTTKKKESFYDYTRYDEFCDDMTNEEYDEYTAKLFNKFDHILKKDGVILYNINYGSENTDGMFTAINSVIVNTPFTVADVIVWKKSCAMPNNCSPNKLTRVWEFVFVMCRKTEIKTFKTNKPVSGHRERGNQTMYVNVPNFIAAKNNDGKCPYNKATYSSDLCEQLLKIYARENSVVYDPFMGSGTTAVACERMGFFCIGSEISKKQCNWAWNRINDVRTKELGLEAYPMPPEFVIQPEEHKND